MAGAGDTGKVMQSQPSAGIEDSKESFNTKQDKSGKCGTDASHARARNTQSHWILRQDFLEEVASWRSQALKDGCRKEVAHQAELPA